VSFARLHKLVTYALAALGLGSLGLGGELSPFVLVLVAFLALASWFAEGPRIFTPGWQRTWNIGLLAFGALQIARGALGDGPLGLALEFTAALQISRLCNRRRAAEHQQIAILAFLHLCAATVLSNEITYGALFLGFVVLVPWMLALTHLRAEIEGHFAPRSAVAEEPETTLGRVLASRRLVGASFLAGTAALSLPLFLSTALLFLAFPRVGLGFLAFGEGDTTHVAGFGNEVTLGDVGVIRDDATIVMHVLPPEPLRRGHPSHVAVLLRGTSFDAYDGRRWTRTQTAGTRIRRVEDDFPITRFQDPDRDAGWDIVLTLLDQEVVFLPEHTVAVEVPPRFSAGIDIGRDLVLSAGHEVRYEDPDALGLRYRAWTSSGERPEAVEAITADDLARYLALPPDHEPLAAIATRWTEGATTDRQRAERIAAHLGGSEFSYSLEMTDPGDLPPLVAFLERTRRGHCEYFASAMAILLREVGVPSRNVTGFSGATYNSYGDYWVVQSGDAHAWVEAYLEGEGWVSFDPTPASTRVETNGLGRELSALVDALRTRWDTWVVGYDLRSQRNLARTIGDLFGGGTSHERRIQEDEASSAPSSPSRTILVVVGLVALVILADRAYRALLGRRTRSAGVPEIAREIVSLYRELEKELVRLGAPRPPSVTPLEHARALEQRPFPGADVVLAITQRYVEVRFGGSVAAPTELAELRRRVRALRSIARPEPAKTA
jgi:transglutaminase-like putative cysteine protease